MAIPAYGDARKGKGLAGVIAKAMKDLQPNIDFKAEDADVFPNAIAAAIIEYFSSSDVSITDSLGQPCTIAFEDPNL